MTFSMKKHRKNIQTSLINIKGAGRPAKNDPGIRHTKRPRIRRPSSLHLTVKIKKERAAIKNKTVLRILKKAIQNARAQGLRVIHYTLEYDHVHLLIEADNNTTLGKGMKSFGVTLAKALNRLRSHAGGVYKHRYHFKHITGTRQLKNVMNYIFLNGVKHKTSKHKINPFNSLRAEEKYFLFTKTKLEFDLELIRLLDRGLVYYHGLEFI